MEENRKKLLQERNRQNKLDGTIYLSSYSNFKLVTEESDKSGENQDNTSTNLETKGINNKKKMIRKMT
jgi:hypothetical protein